MRNIKLQVFYGFIWVFLAFLGDYYFVHQVLYLNSQIIKIDSVIISSPYILLYFIFFPILTSAISTKCFRINRLLVGLIGVLPFLIRLLLFVINVHFFPFQKLSIVDYSSIEYKLVGYNFFVLILIMYILSIIFQYIFGNSDKDKAG